MKRSHFFNLLLGLPFGSRLLGETLKSDNFGDEYLLNEFYVAGFQYYKGSSLIEQIEPGEPLKLTADPENRYDRFAVTIHWHGEMLGHVPRGDNRHISRLLQQGVPLSCHVLEANPGEETWNMLRVEVCMERSLLFKEL